jgi:hypothetical protein
MSKALESYLKQRRAFYDKLGPRDEHDPGELRALIEAFQKLSPGDQAEADRRITDKRD